MPQQATVTGKAHAVGFIGAGKVGTALASLLHTHGIEVVGVSGRIMLAGRRMAQEAGLDPSLALSRADTVQRSSLVFLTVPDDDIVALCEEISRTEGWRRGQGVVHCSGALPSHVLAPARAQGALVASFHPLQAFASLEAALENMSGSAFAIEGDAPLVPLLASFARLLGGTPLCLTSEQKTLYHAAATIASNYTVTLTSLAASLMVDTGVATDEATALSYLLPLLRGTVDNLSVLGLPGGLTGPLSRGDAGTVSRHLTALEESNPELAHLYRHLAWLTLPLAQRKGHLSGTTMEMLQNLLETGFGSRPK